ncbi:hypothetical protein H1C71_035517, partial [Ictidomys tridecemlineatus]
EPMGVGEAGSQCPPIAGRGVSPQPIRVEGRTNGLAVGGVTGEPRTASLLGKPRGPQGRRPKGYFCSFALSAVPLVSSALWREEGPTFRGFDRRTSNAGGTEPGCPGSRAGVPGRRSAARI